MEMPLCPNAYGPLGQKQSGRNGNMKTKSLVQATVALKLSTLTAQLLLLATFASAAEMSDTTPPQLESLAISPTVIDTSSNSQTILLTVRLTDDLSGFAAPEPGAPFLAGAWAEFTSPAGDVDSPILYVSFSPAMRVSGDDFDGIYTNALIVPRFSRTGNWTLLEFYVSDAVGNRRQMSLAELRRLGFPTQFTVQGIDDINPPDIVSASISPSTVDTSNSNQPITITLHLQDDLAGIGTPGQVGYSMSQISFVSPSGTQYAGTYFTADQRAAGDAYDGVYTNTLWLPRFSEPGTWSLNSLMVVDAAGNERQIGLAEALDSGLPAEFTVQGTGDVTPPQLCSLDFSPKRITTDNSSQTIAVTVRLVDDMSGMSNSVPGYASWGYASAMFLSPSKSQSASVSFGAWNRAAGSNLDGVYTNTMNLPQFSETGVWTLANVSLMDAAGNSTYLESADLSQLGFPTQFAVGIAPSLTITRFPSSILLSWPAWASDFSLQSRDGFDPSTPWIFAGLNPVVLGEDAVVTVPVFAGQRFYRLAGQP
jgi:hypothetical protein